MRILTYNLYEGAQTNYPQLKDFIAKQKPDVLCLQEANGWHEGTQRRLDDFSASVGMPHWVFGDSNTRFKLATFSRLPIVSSKVHTDGFWHSAIRTTVEHKGKPLSVWNIHLDPKDEDRRLKEVERLLRLVTAGIVTGDFNSLSRADRYPDALTRELDARGIVKFGKNELRYDVTERFARAGFVDAAVALGLVVPTVPTPVNKDKYHAASLRLDYMFVSSGLAKAIKGIEVPKTSLTDKISDHYPVVLEI